MIRKNVLTHGIAITAICLFGFFALGSVATTPKLVVAPTTIASSETKSNGSVHDIPVPRQKPFTSLGLVFVSSTTEFDEKGNVISSQEGIVTMLLREAQKLGADDIINLRVDENVTWIETTSEGSSSSSTKTKKKIVTLTGSALVIKYLNTEYDD
jgi:hypothetical protein